MKEEKKGIPLIESNPYLRVLTEVQHRYLVEMSAYESSVASGARGLKRPPMTEIYKAIRKSKTAKASVKNIVKTS